MQRQHRRLAGRIIHVLGDGDIARNTRQRHNVSVILLYHVWQEGLDRAEVGESVDVKGFFDRRRRRLEDCRPGREAGIIDENCGGAVVGLDQVRGVGYGLGGCKVGFIEEGVGSWN